MARKSRTQRSKRISKSRSRKRKPQNASVSTAIVPVAQPQVIRWHERKMPQEKIDLLKRTVAKGTDNDQFELFLSVCQRHGLDPFVKQVYCVLWPISKHHQDEKGIWLPGHEMVIITGIGGYRKMAARDHKDYAGSSDAEYTWFDPPRNTPAGREIPRSATVRVHRRGAEDTIATVYWEEFAPGDLTDKRADFWNRTPKNQLEKCAEAKGLRKAFPGLGDVFTEEELSQRLQDITPGGREIVQSDGRSPSGRPLTYEARMAANLPEITEGVPRGGSREAAQEVLKQKLEAAQAPAVPPAQKAEPWKFAGSVTIDFTADPPIVTGDVQELVPHFPQTMALEWGKDGFWHVKTQDLIPFRQACVKVNFEIREIRPSKAPPTKQRHDVSEAVAKRGSGGGGNPTAAPATVSGFIEQANPESGKTPRMAVLFKIGKTKYWMTAFSDKLFPWLIKGKEKNLPCELIVTKREKDGKTYTNIVGLKMIGGQEFDEDGKTPVIDNRTREAGGRTLFP